MKTSNKVLLGLAYIGFLLVMAVMVALGLSLADNYLPLSMSRPTEIPDEMIVDFDQFVIDVKNGVYGEPVSSDDNYKRILFSDTGYPEAIGPFKIQAELTHYTVAPSFTRFPQKDREEGKPTSMIIESWGFSYPENFDSFILGLEADDYTYINGRLMEKMGGIRRNMLHERYEITFVITNVKWDDTSTFVSGILDTANSMP